jgi:hypothetical protein
VSLTVVKIPARLVSAKLAQIVQKDRVGVEEAVIVSHS